MGKNCRLPITEYAMVNKNLEKDYIPFIGLGIQHDFSTGGIQSEFITFFKPTVFNFRLCSASEESGQI
jgi:hypothetical protein